MNSKIRSMLREADFRGENGFLNSHIKHTRRMWNLMMILCSAKQGSGFIRIQSRVPFKLEYDNIYAVDVKKKYSIPNTVAAIFFIILAIAIETWIAIPLALLLLWIGKTCVVIIHNQNGKYEIPVEFMTEAEDLRNRIAAAQSQAMRK